jgi:hypothetical protein
MVNKVSKYDKSINVDYVNVYKNIFSQNNIYNEHINDRERYDFVIDEIKKNNYNKVIDISSGRGNMIKCIKDIFPDINITSTDLLKFNDIKVDFIQLDLTSENDRNSVRDKYDFLSCLDVLEHIEENEINNILRFFKSISKNFCFSIANHSDVQNGVEVHLIQKDKIFWDKILSEHLCIVESFIKYENKLYCYVLKTHDDISTPNS